ncbi:MAG: tetratricopeptide repeat protein [Brevinema sp.]
MKNTHHYSQLHSVYYKILTNFCIFVFFISVLLFLYLFFYQSIHTSFKRFKDQNVPLAPIYDTPTIQIPHISENTPTTPTSSELTTFGKDHKEAERIFVAYDLGDYVLSSRLIVDFLSDYPESTYRHKVRLIGANLMNQRGDYEGALAYIKKILGETSLSNEDYSESVLLLGSIARERKQYDSYIQSFLEQAYFRAEEPTKSKISFYLGYLLLHKGDFQSSLKYFNNVIGEDGVLGKSDLYAAQSMRPERINELENFIKAYPSSKNFSYVTSSFVKEISLLGEELTIRGYLDSTERFYRKILTHFSDSAEGDDARLKIAELYYQKQKLEDSIAILQEALKNENTSKDADVLFMLGKTSFEMNRPEDSLGYFRVLTEKYPSYQYIAKVREWQNLIFDILRN